MQTNSQAAPVFCKISISFSYLNLTELFACPLLVASWTPRAPPALNNSHIICTQPTKGHFSYFLLHRWRHRLSLCRRGEGRRAAGGFESASFRRRLFELRGWSSRCRRRRGLPVWCRHRWGCDGWGRGRGFSRRRRPRFGEHDRRLLVRLAGCGIQGGSFGCWMNKAGGLARKMRRLEKMKRVFQLLFVTSRDWRYERGDGSLLVTFFFKIFLTLKPSGEASHSC